MERWARWEVKLLFVEFLKFVLANVVFIWHEKCCLYSLQISNFEYLMQLNTLAGRSYNDITQVKHMKLV